MAEMYFLKLREDSTPEDFNRVSALLNRARAQVLMASPLRKWFLAALEKKTAEELKRTRKVEALGGVTLRQREIKVVRRTERQPAKGG